MAIIRRDPTGLRQLFYTWQKKFHRCFMSTDSSGDHSTPETPSTESSITEDTQQLQKPTFFQVFLSVLSAIFGVQSSKNRERDFKAGDPKQFIAVYIVIVIAIVLLMITLVRTVLHFATG